MMATTRAVATTKSTVGRMNTLHDACSLATWWSVARSPGLLLMVTNRSVVPGAQSAFPGMVP